jgi:hydrogenase 3 maturation protease
MSGRAGPSPPRSAAGPCERPLDALGTALRGRACVLGVGNRERGDDAFGPIVVERLQGRTGALCLDAGVAPENFLEEAARAKPETVLIVDAADFGGAPGELRLLDPAALTGGLSTHAASLELVAQYLAARTGATVRVAAVQGVSQRAGEPLSPPVARAAEELVERLADPRGDGAR